MSTRLERYVWMTIAVVALSVALLAGLPAVAKAQTEAPERHAEQSTHYQGTHYQGTDTPAGLRVVSPGDSLWSIAQEQLGPNAAPESVANEVERIHWLNHDRIGEDPNLILAGQELWLLPAAASAPEPTSSEPAAAEPSSEASSAQERADAQEASAKQPAALPELEESETELVAASIGEPPATTPERDADTRHKVGYAVLLFTLAVAFFGTARLLNEHR